MVRAALADRGRCRAAVDLRDDLGSGGDRPGPPPQPCRRPHPYPAQKSGDLLNREAEQEHVAQLLQLRARPFTLGRSFRILIEMGNRGLLIAASGSAAPFAGVGGSVGDCWISGGSTRLQVPSLPTRPPLRNRKFVDSALEETVTSELVSAHVPVVTG